MESENIIIQSPTSFTGSARRIWRLTDLGPEWLKIGTIPVAILLTGFAWVFCAAWLAVFGIFVVPWRLLRRGSRKRKLEAARHREQLAAIASMSMSVEKSA